MQRFYFRLETLLKYRKLKTDQAQVELGQAISAWQQEQEKLASLNADNDRAEDWLRQLQQTKVAAEELMRYHSFRERLKQAIAVQTEKVERAAIYIAECREQLAEALRQQKLVEKIKEKRYAQYQEELLRQEQKELDEIGLQLYVRGD